MFSRAQNFTWIGSDPNGDALPYNILYSLDNSTTWMGIGSVITGNIYNIDFSGLPGANRAHVNTAVGETDQIEMVRFNAITETTILMSPA